MFMVAGVICHIASSTIGPKWLIYMTDQVGFAENLEESQTDGKNCLTGKK